MRINYPESWPQSARDELDAMFAEARAKGLWFYISSLTVSEMWFSPDELEAEQKNGKFIWGAVNWRLRPPHEMIAEKAREVENARNSYDRAIARLRHS